MIRVMQPVRSKAAYLLATVTLGAGITLIAPSPVASAKGVTEVTSCSFAALDTAISGGGKIEYEQNCNGSTQDVVFPTEVIFKGTADIEANGYGVTFYGSTTRL